MKINKLTIVLLIIIIILVSYIVYDKVSDKSMPKEESIYIKDSIELEYAKIYLLSNGISYIEPINDEKIDNLNVHNNLKERLKTLYLRAFYQDIYIGNYKLKAFKVSLDDEIRSIHKIELEDNTYIVFVKENNTIGLFNYLEYYDLLYTDVVDNYKNIKNVLEVQENKIIYLDGGSKLLIEE